MAAGYIYNLDPVVEQEERYKVDTGVRRIGAFKLVTTGLTAGSILPSFTPICADLVAKTATVVRNVTVYEDAAADATFSAASCALSSISFLDFKFLVPWTAHFPVCFALCIALAIFV